MAKKFRLITHGWEVGVRILPCNQCCSVRRVHFSRSRVNFSILNEMWGNISLAHGLAHWSPFLSNPLRVEKGLQGDKFCPFSDHAVVRNKDELTPVPLPRYPSKKIGLVENP